MLASFSAQIKHLARQMDWNRLHSVKCTAEWFISVNWDETRWDVTCRFSAISWSQRLVGTAIKMKNAADNRSDEINHRQWWGVSPRSNWVQCRETSGWVAAVTGLIVSTLNKTSSWGNFYTYFLSAVQLNPDLWGQKTEGTTASSCFSPSELRSGAHLAGRLHSLLHVGKIWKKIVL